MIQLFSNSYIDFDFDLIPYKLDGYKFIIASKCKGILYNGDLSPFNNILFNFNSLDELRDNLSDNTLFNYLYNDKIILFLGIEDIHKFLCLYLKIFVGKEYCSDYSIWENCIFNKYLFHIKLEYSDEINIFPPHQIPSFLSKRKFLDLFNLYLQDVISYTPNIKNIYNNITTNFTDYNLLVYSSPELMMMNGIFKKDTIEDNISTYKTNKFIKLYKKYSSTNFTKDKIKKLEDIINKEFKYDRKKLINIIKYNEPKYYFQQNGNFFENNVNYNNFKFKFEMNYDKSTYKFIY